MRHFALQPTRDTSERPPHGFKEIYNSGRLIEREGFKTPREIKEALAGQATAA
jgi:hypothetical protein